MCIDANQPEQTRRDDPMKKMTAKRTCLMIAAVAWCGMSSWAAEKKAATATVTVEPVQSSVTVSVITNGPSGAMTIDSDAINRIVQSALAGQGGVQIDAKTVEAITKAVQTAVPGLLGNGQAGAISVGALPAAGGTMVIQNSSALEKSVPQTWLGLSSGEVGDEVRAQLPLEEGVGLLVNHVEEDSPAAKAGVQANDILTRLDDQILVSPDQLRQLIRMHKEGDTIALKGLRKGKETSCTATLGKKEVDAEDPEVHVISFGDAPPIKMELPAEIKKMLESAGGGSTVFSTSIVIRSSSARMEEPHDVLSHSGISVKTANGKTTITYKGKQVFSGPTSGNLTTQSANENGEEYAAAYDGDKMIWESDSGAADRLKK
jgi:hypothetical protein